MHLKKTAVRLTASLVLLSTLAVPALAASGTVNAEGSSLRVRSQANTNSAVLGSLSHGTQVEVNAVTESGWYQISYNGAAGYVSGDYLTVADAAQLPVEKEPVYARVTASALNVRSGPGTDYEKTDKLSAGTVVEVLEESNGWYKIDSGYISAEYAVIVDVASATLGSEIANYALTFVGYPYVYGGSSPSGFDCSGFTSYVYAQFGISLNRSASNQLDNGTPVSMSELQPGDLVLFKKSGTGSKRASHVGIYIGGNQFVHASTSTVGVIVSNMSDAYYTSGFVGGRRLV